MNAVMPIKAEQHSATIPNRVINSVTLTSIIADASTNPAVDIAKLERLLAMRERLIEREAMQAFDEAMAQAQNELRTVAADSDNSSTKSRYASYAAIDRVVRPIYAKHGFSLSFNTEPGAPDQHVRVVCRVAHVGGHDRDYRIDMPADGKGAKGGDVMTRTHATGSAVSYGMRYLLKMIFNVAVSDHDDDGNAASTRRQDDPGRISNRQLAELMALITEVGADETRFLRYLKIAALADLPADRFDEAVAALNSKRRRPA